MPDVEYFINRLLNTGGVLQAPTPDVCLWQGAYTDYDLVVLSARAPPLLNCRFHRMPIPPFRKIDPDWLTQGCERDFSPPTGGPVGQVWDSPNSNQ